MQTKDVVNYLLDDAEKITTRAKSQNRGLTDEERKCVEQNLERVQEFKDNAKIADVIEGMKYGRPATSAPAATSSGAVVFHRAGFGEFAKSVADGFPAHMKATLTVGGGGIPSTYVPPGSAVTVAREAVRLRSLFPMERVDAPSVWFRRITTGSTAAATVAEGDLKPEATIAVTSVEAPVRKVAVFLPVTDGAIADGGQSFVGELVDDLVRDLIRAGNAQILNGNGTAPNLRGILQTTGIQTRARGTDSNLDAVLKAVTMLQTTAFLPPTHLLLNPANFETIRLAKASGSGDYLLGDPLTQGQPTLMGANIVLTTDVPAGTGVLLNANEAARVYLREDVRVDFGTTGDLFQRNITAIVAEARLALAVRRPAAIATVTGLN